MQSSYKGHQNGKQVRSAVFLKLMFMVLSCKNLAWIQVCLSKHQKEDTVHTLYERNLLNIHFKTQNRRKPEIGANKCQLASCFKLHTHRHASHDWTSQDTVFSQEPSGALKLEFLSFNKKKNGIRILNPQLKDSKGYQRLLVCYDHCHITGDIAPHRLLDGIQ